MKKIPGFQDYFCDVDGNIYSKKLKYLSTPQKMKKKINKFGYENISLSLGKKGKQKTFLVHRLILLTFKGNDKKRLFCNHKNGNRSDNRLENLEWVTRSENEQHAIKKLGKNLKGENHPSHKLTNDKVKMIRQLRNQGMSYQKIADMFSIGLSCCARIANKEKWKHV